MKNCCSCGRPIDDNACVCSFCGVRQPYGVPYTFPTTAAVAAPKQKSVRRPKGSIALLIWSLILIPFCNIIGTPLAAAAALICLSVIGGKSRVKISTAVAFCVASTVVTAATLIGLGTSAFLILKNAGFSF